MNDPKVLTFRKNMTLVDALIQSGGFSTYADNENINVYRNVSSKNESKYSENFIVNINKDFNSPEFYLEPGDLIIVKKVENYLPLEFFTVDGEVENKGEFGIEYSKYDLKDAFDKIKFKASANMEGIHIIRDSIKNPVITNETKLKNSSIQLMNGDQIIVPKINNTVSTNGAIQNESILPFEKNISAKNYINISGGFLKNADKSKLFVTYANGKSMSTKKILGIFYKYPKVLAGSSITVPPKVEKEKEVLRKYLV